MEYVEDFADFDYIDDDAELIDLIEYGFPKKIYQRTNYFQTMDELTFFRRFRLYKETVYYILTQIEHDLEYTHNRNNSVAPMDQLLTALRYYASAGHLVQTADMMNMDLSTTSRIISRVSRVIARLFPMYVHMPERQSILNEQNSFYNVARFPRIIGVVDGTHVRVQSPVLPFVKGVTPLIFLSNMEPNKRQREELTCLQGVTFDCTELYYIFGHENAEIYRNRKGYFSLNVQVVGNADLKFLDVVERWPGSSHDATIFGHCNLRARFEGGEFPDSILLGDSGYPLRNFLLTPLQNPVTRAEQLYQESLVRTRNIIERIIGIWKRRFPIVAYGSRLKLSITKAIVVATTVLHNIARQMNEPEDVPAPEFIDPQHLDYLIEAGNIEMPRVQNQLGRVDVVQREIINFFGAL